ncbi:family 16 glycosylhydrolase [Maribacter hydrothermalis]|uniref:Uncharacterized protein n=1 Tax=Maribacter hydrothermalis TaxID=1836467 RepID=A0A1B7ZFD2_9FLAO|nr:family 16 glycosylhydrolase [Maribacter hydrothermalis]APQ17784.1 hypothetical protein BTR34_10790 [Maribacter hydrothermalis]OBR42258.1 hypothetical protein A9200_02410 [Maribacter hydrothermalis]
MKSLMFILVAFFMVFTSCEEDDSFNSGPLSNLTVSSVVSTNGSGIVSFKSSASGAKSYSYDFGDGTTGESLTGSISKTYVVAGINTYTVTITATGYDGSTKTETVQVTIDIPVTNSDLVNLITGGNSKTWFLAAAQPGHLGLGPAREGIDGDWWYPKWYSAQAFEKCGSEISDCFCDDELTFSVDSSGDVTYVLDNKGQTFFNVGHKAVVGGTADEDFCYDYDTSGEKEVTFSAVEGNVPEAETTGMQMEFSDGGFMSYYVGSSTYEILSISDNLLYVRTYDTMNPDLAWYIRFTSAPAIGGGDESLETIYTNLVWSDEFDIDGAPNPLNWTYDLGAGGWGNSEAQTYTSESENVKVEDGVLKITAIAGVGEAAVHYFDDVTLIASGGATESLENFEGTAPVFTGFGGTETVVVDNPNTIGDNTSAKVAESTKGLGAETWAGSFFDLATPIDLVAFPSISIKTWSPAVGANVILKLENQANADENVEFSVTTATANEWEILTFDFSAAPAGTYDRVVVFFDFGVSPSGGITSARIKSENLFEFTYGRVEIRAKLPSAGGSWPALWALGANFDEVSWPACGEIDIMEHVGNNSNTISSALHYPGNFGGSAVVGSTLVPTATSEFHNYTVEWTADSIKFVVDGELVHNSLVNSSSTPFNSDFFLIMNVAMGGNLGGTIDPAFTQDTMEVDYVRVYQ